MHMCHWTKDGLHKHIGGWSSIHFHRDLYILKMDDIHLPNSAYLFWPRHMSFTAVVAFLEEIPNIAGEDNAAISTTQQLESLESPHFLHYSVATCDCACCPVSLRVQRRNHWLVFKSIFLLWTSHKLALGGIIDVFLSPRFHAVSTISVLTNIYYTDSTCLAAWLQTKCFII